ncbi:TOTE conflict system archaeo-eukaryotic primase domain-containing protein [Lentzea roselyniae]|uniref:TOTE conflict system archaeo-eukaryotic primase domain-containing protein n=1 Tax=Lentzea roselyniae TaxID=531940 RepID=UPI0031F97F17
MAYLKAARTWSVPAALEVSRSGVGAHAWVFFAAPVPAETAQQNDLADTLILSGWF